MASTVDKVKHALHMDKSHNSGTAEGVAGPHDSRVANAADPRVDSDMDGSRNAGAHTGMTGTTGGYTTGTGIGNSTASAGPHNSNLANKADPRVDSTTGAHTIGSTTTGHTGTTGGYTGTTGGHTGITGGHTTGGAGNYTTTAGPHSSNLANKADPRVDSTTGAHTIGSSTTRTGGIGTGTGTAGGISTSTNAGPHNSNAANKLDPRVDSDRDGSHVLGGGTHATPGSGTAQNTAGPHGSDMANKLDPRVDADLDGSKTFPTNKTYI